MPHKAVINQFPHLQLYDDLMCVADDETRVAFCFSPRIGNSELTPLIAYDAFGIDPVPIVSDIS